MNIEHESIGQRVRRNDVIIQMEEFVKNERIRRYMVLPWRKIEIDQATVWILWATMMATVFLACTVSAVTWAVR